jgi:hypothetical protein
MDIIVRPAPRRLRRSAFRARHPGPLRPWSRSSIRMTWAWHGVGDTLWSVSLLLTCSLLVVPLVRGSAAAGMTVAALAASLIVLTLGRIQINRRTLGRAIRARDELTELIARGETRVHDESRALTAQIHTELGPAIARIQALLEGPDERAPDRIVRELTSTVTDIVRPLTQRLDHPIAETLTAIRVTPHRWKLHWVPRRGWHPGGVSALLWVAVTVLVMVAARSSGGPALQWAGWGGVVLLPWVALQLVTRDGVTATQLADEHEQIHARIRGQLWVSRRNLTWVLHGPIQSALIASALALSQSENTAALREKVWQNVSSALARLDGSFLAHPDLESALEEISAVWSINCDIDWFIAEEACLFVAGDRVAVMCVSEIAREAVNNAVRHGHARTVHGRIEVDSSLAGRVLSVTITNDGDPVPVPVERGLGSAMFDELSHSWARVSEDGWTTLIASIPAQSP